MGFSSLFNRGLQAIPTLGTLCAAFLLGLTVGSLSLPKAPLLVSPLLVLQLWGKGILTVQGVGRHLELLGQLWRPELLGQLSSGGRGTPDTSSC